MTGREDLPRGYDAADPPRFGEWVRLRKLGGTLSTEPTVRPSLPRRSTLTPGPSPSLAVKTSASAPTGMQRLRPLTWAAPLLIAGVLVIGAVVLRWNRPQETRSNASTEPGNGTQSPGLSVPARQSDTASSHSVSPSPAPSSSGHASSERAELEAEAARAEQEYNEVLQQYNEVALPMAEHSEEEYKKAEQRLASLPAGAKRKGKHTLERAKASAERSLDEAESRRDRNKAIAAAVQKRAENASEAMKAARQRLAALPEPR